MGRLLKGRRGVKAEGGFTFIEAAVVICIVGVLATVSPGMERDLPGLGGCLFGVGIALFFGAVVAKYNRTAAIFTAAIGATLAVILHPPSLGNSPLVRKSHEAFTMAKLSDLRAALEERVKNDGGAPKDLAGLLSSVAPPPQAKTPFYHPNSASVMFGEHANDDGGWGYFMAPDAKRGRFFVNCTHTDSKGTQWASY